MKKNKYRIPGIGGLPSKSLKEQQKKPLPMCIMKPIKEVINSMKIGTIWIDEAEENKCKPKTSSTKPSKNP